MDIILCSVEWQVALAYLDDTVILSESPDEHINGI